MIFEQIKLSQMDNFCYLIGDDKECAIVDPAWDDQKILDVAKKHDLEVTKIILTHTHFDHTEGCKRMQDLTGAAVYVHKNGKNSVQALGVSDINLVEDNEDIKVGSLTVKTIPTPGHIQDMMCLLIENKLITGDTLFVEGCGRVDLPGSDIKQQWDSLVKLKKMDENIEVYPGHDYGTVPSSTIKYEKENNHFLKCNNFEEFNNVR